MKERREHAEAAPHHRVADQEADSLRGVATRIPVHRRGDDRNDRRQHHCRHHDRPHEEYEGEVCEAPTRHARHQPHAHAAIHVVHAPGERAEIHPCRGDDHRRQGDRRVTPARRTCRDGGPTPA